MPALYPAVVHAAHPARRIGFVDDDLDNYHARVYLQIIRGDLKERGFVVTGATALQHEESRAWAAKQQLAYYESAEQFNKVVDCFAILAPATPKTHWELCRRVLPFGKTTFVDKSFAPDHDTAEKIFALADLHNVAVQSTSALRYTEVQKYVAMAGREHVRHVVTWGPGSNYDEYVIHPVELAVSCLGHEVRSLMRRGTEPESQLLINFTNGRTAVVHVYNKKQTPYAASVTTDKQTRYFEVDTKRLFLDAAAALLDFLAAGKPDIDRHETLAIMRILDAARDPAALERWVKL
jgi:predicted dehydrogenase